MKSGDPIDDFDGDREIRAALVAVPGVVELEAEAFRAVEELMGEHELALAWPKDHFRSVPDTRYEVDPDDQPEDLDPGHTDGRLFLVRSPWPAVDLDTVIKMMFRWLRRNEDEYVLPGTRTEGGYGVDTAAQLAVASQFLRQSESWARAYQRGRVNKLS